MTADDIRIEIEIELEHLAAIAREIEELRRNLAGREPGNVEKAAAGAFLCQFYGGFENILSRICKFHGLPLPEGPQWHKTLLQWFCNPPREGLPLLFDKLMESDMEEYRRFRHLFIHGYSILLEWSRMEAGVENVPGLYLRLSSRIRKAAENLALKP